MDNTTYHLNKILYWTQRAAAQPSKAAYAATKVNYSVRKIAYNTRLSYAAALDFVRAELAAEKADPGRLKRLATGSALIAAGKQAEAVLL